jgi:hypothetical protein
MLWLFTCERECIYVPPTPSKSWGPLTLPSPGDPYEIKGTKYYRGFINRKRLLNRVVVITWMLILDPGCWTLDFAS